MKKILTLLLSGLITASVTAQTITIAFNTVNKNRNYQVVVDGTSYYSNDNSTVINNGVNKGIVLSNQQTGSHSIAVYRLKNNNGNYTTGNNTTINGNEVYSNTFQLRQGYDMGIEISQNGQVTFTEKKIRKGNRGGYNQQSMPPMADAAFDQLMKNVRSKWLTSAKATVENDAFTNSSNYFTTSQVRQLLLLLSTETTRLGLAKLAYARVVDPANFTQLYDVFNSTSNKNDLDNYVRNNPNNNGNNGGYNSQYKNAMASYEFSQLLQNVNNQWNQAGKINTVKSAFNNTSSYFNTSQIRQVLSVINSQNDRLELAKMSYARVSDASSFTSLYDLFYSQSSKDELNNFISGNINNQYNTKTAIAEYQFNQLLQNINYQSSQSGKFIAIKDAFNNNSYYFTTAQIRQLLSTMTAEYDRLALAKLSYSKATDPANFTSIYDLFYNQSSKSDLNNYVLQMGGTGNNTQYNSKVPMADDAFSQVLQKAGNHFFAWDKTRDVRDVFNNTSYNFTTSQIRQLLSLIAAENDKLELAKLAWARVTDPSYFTQLNDLFLNQSNRDNLNTYINAHPAY